MRFKRSKSVADIERVLDGVEDGASSVVSGFKKDKYTDLGHGVFVPSKDVIRGLQRLHEAKMPLFERIVQFLSIGTFVLVLLMLIKLV